MKRRLSTDLTKLRLILCANKSLNGHITRKEAELVINNLATKKSPAHLGFIDKFCQT